MTGTKTITDLITDKETIKAGRINIIEAPVSSGSYVRRPSVPSSTVQTREINVPGFLKK